jgi:hypothetical protein
MLNQKKEIKPFEYKFENPLFLVNGKGYKE